MFWYVVFRRLIFLYSSNWNIIDKIESEMCGFESKRKDACFLAWLLTLPCFYNLVKVLEIPTVGTVLRAAIGVNLLTEVANLWEEKHRKELVSRLFFFNWKKLVVGDLKAIAMENQRWLCLAGWIWVGWLL